MPMYCGCFDLLPTVARLCDLVSGTEEENQMQRSLAFAALMLALGACADLDKPTCYKIIESVTTEAGSRALAVTPCPADQQR